ncbi:metallophosphoesterase family protein [Larkinella bovis]|uniref:Metallophosphoesterase family protein n=1 Tax=Larkinella bovis TaxID=683041 RepID=A0ABW0I7K9_9BACT
MGKLSRERFLKLTAQSTFAVPFLKENRLQDEPKKDEKLVFRFLQVNDLHVQNESSRYLKQRIAPAYAGANTRAIWLREALRGGQFFPEVDFVLSVGDMIHGNTLEGVKYDMDFFHRYFYSDFPLPFYPVMGNHENVQNEGDPVFEGSYIQAFGKDKINYSFVHKGLHFIIFNNSGSWVVKDSGILEYRLKSLRQLLDLHPTLPKIVCCHIPLVSVRTKEVLAKSFGFTSFYTKEQEIGDLIRQYNPKVLAVLSGHLHISGMVNTHAIHHVVLSGLASYPHDMALYSVYSDRIDVEFVRVPSDLLQPETNIHGAKRFGFDYTDELHTDYSSYLMGNSQERRFSIPIKKNS